MHNRQQKLLDYLRLYGSISNSEAQSITGAHRNTISLDFKRLLQEGVLYSEGTKKSTRYFLKSEKIFPAALVSKLRKLPTIHAYFNANNQKKVFFVQTHEQALQAKLYFDEDIEDRFRQCLPQIDNKRQQLSSEERKRRKERLTIDLAWASSSIEGSTYSLLETEALILHHQDILNPTGSIHAPIDAAGITAKFRGINPHLDTGAIAGVALAIEQHGARELLGLLAGKI